MLYYVFIQLSSNAHARAVILSQPTDSVHRTLMKALHCIFLIFSAERHQEERKELLSIVIESYVKI